MGKILLCLAFLFCIQKVNSQTFLSENFETISADNWQLQNLSSGGTPANAAWTIRQSPYLYGGATFSSNDASKFIMSNSDAQGLGGTTHAILRSPAFSTLGSATVFLNYFHHFTYAEDTDSAIVEVSINNTTWTKVAGYHFPGSDEGIPNSFNFRSLNISAYVANQPTVYVRFRHKALYAFYWAIDNITVTSNGSALPVKFSEFSGISKSGQNHLQWKTSTEINNSGFELERSLDGIKFAGLKFVHSKSPDGNSNSELRYEYTDANPVGGKQYYRLKQIDQDGNFTYSNIVVLKSKGRNYFSSSIFPNPVISQVNLVLHSAMQERSRLQVFDIAGRMVVDKTVQLEQGKNTIQFPAGQLKSGTYFTRFLFSDGSSVEQKFIKQ
jgi:hypothetical protein